MEEKTDLRVRKTHLALHNAFLSLMEEKRFDELTVNELCDRAMIRRTTFYKHFADKYDYFSFYIREVVGSFRTTLTPEVIQGGVEGYVIYMVRQTVRFLRQHDKLVQNVKNSSVFPVLLNILLEQISSDIAKLLRRVGSDLSRTDAEGIAAFYAGGLTNVVFQYLKQDLPLDEEQLVDIVASFLPSHLHPDYRVC